MNTFNLRRTISLSSLLVLGLLGTSSSILAQAPAAKHEPAGSWLYTVTIPVSNNPADNVIFQGLETYIPGGSYVETDQLSFSPVLGLSTPSHGSWESLSSSTFLLTYLNFTYDSTGKQQGTSKVRQVATLSTDGNSYTGGGDFAFRDPKGNVTLAGTFTITATRIQVQAPSQVVHDPTFVQNLETYGRVRRFNP